MSYCAILIPQMEAKTEEGKSRSTFDKLTGKLMSGVTSGGLNFDNATTVLKNTAKLIAENSDEITNKFSGIALTQLMTEGKISNDTAFGYLTQGFPQALNQSAIAMGFQSVEQLKNALRNKNGVNVQQFIKAFQNAGTSLTNFFDGQKNREDVEGFDVVEIDAVLNDTRNYISETPDRRVQSGQTYQEYVHNLPETINLECVLQNGRNYTGDEFEDILRNLRDRKIAVKIILGDTTKENMVLTLFTPNREAMDGYAYSLEFKEVKAGTVELVPLNIKISTGIKKVVNKLAPKDTKTVEEVSNGYQKALDETKGTFGKAWEGIKAGFKLGWGK